MRCEACLLDLELNAPIIDEKLDRVCPNCGKKVEEPSGAVLPTPEKPQSGMPNIFFGSFWSTVKDLIFAPTAFFEKYADGFTSEGGLSYAIAFSVLIQWLASFFNFLWHSAIATSLERRLHEFIQVMGNVSNLQPQFMDGVESYKSQVIDFLFGAGAVVLTPFSTLFKILLVSAFVHIGVRLFIPVVAGERPRSFQTTIKIIAYAYAPWILCVIPGLGLFLAWLLTFSAAVIGLRVVYKTSTPRAMFAYLFPELLLLFFAILAMMGILLFTFAMMRMM